MNVTNTIKGVVNATKYTVTAPIIKEDYGLYLKIEGLDLPAVYEVDFSNSENSGSSVTMVGNADGVSLSNRGRTFSLFCTGTAKTLGARFISSASRINCAPTGQKNSLHPKSSR